MKNELQRMTLKTGETLVITVEEPPFDESYDWRGLCWWSGIRERMLSGGLNEWLYAPHFMGWIDGIRVGGMCYYASAGVRDVGVVEFVGTSEQHRRKGIASAVLDALIRNFVEQRGRALYLCTTNPAAGALYEKHGFMYHTGDGMRYLAPGSEKFDHEYFQHAGEAFTRAATWADLPHASALYNHPFPAWYLKDVLTDCSAATRYESHFLRVMKDMEDGLGTVIALEAPNKRLVGMAALRRPNNHFLQHTAVLSFRVCPAYEGQASELLEAICCGAEAMGVEYVTAYVAGSDRRESAILRENGFRMESRLSNRLLTEEGRDDLLLLTRVLSPPESAQREPVEYYGNRKEWQRQRIAEMGRGSPPFCCKDLS